MQFQVPVALLQVAHRTCLLSRRLRHLSVVVRVTIEHLGQLVEVEVHRDVV
jgi:hypothetical protein